MGLVNQRLEARSFSDRRLADRGHDGQKTAPNDQAITDA
jgi:hypothetical protein